MAYSMRSFKVVLMGAGGVGKTSLATQFVQEAFEESYEPTLEEIHRKTITIDGEKYMLELVDTAGLDQFSHLRDPHIKRGDGFILVYSIVDPTTFEDIKTVRAQIVQAKFSEQIPIVLVGNKCDLEEEERVIKMSDGLELASQWPLCQFVETSARNYEDIEAVFAVLTRQIISFENTKKRRVDDLLEEANKTKRKSGKCLVM